MAKTTITMIGAQFKDPVCKHCGVAVAYDEEADRKGLFVWRHPPGSCSVFAYGASSQSTLLDDPLVRERNVT